MTPRNLAFLILLCALSIAPVCGGGNKPGLFITLHGISDDLNDLLIVPADETAMVNLVFSEAGHPVDPATLTLQAIPWNSQAPPPVSLLYGSSSEGAIVLLIGGTLEDGTYTLLATVNDIEGNIGSATFDFAVRTRLGPVPIGSGQQIWYDFTSDRDGTPGPDFALDLETFGLGSPADVALSAQVEATVIEAVLDRVGEVYYEEDPNGFGFADPVDVVLTSGDPGSGDVTRICVGGTDPGGSGAIGSIFIDPNNSNRNSVECGTLPPTGIFPREMDTYSGQAAFQDALGPLMPSLGGTPVGEHALDAIVLAAGFDPGSGTPEEVERYDDIQTAIQQFSDALGSIMAHETGHALGMVAPGAPGPGLHGGQSGVEFAHDVTSDGTTSPTPNYVMKHGGTFNFAKLAGLTPHSLPYLRALDHAYLRDRVMTAPKVTELLPPPTATDVSPASIASNVQVIVTGAGFRSLPSLRLESPTFTYNAVGESFVSEAEVRAWVLPSQLPPGVYDLVVENPDGQTAVLPGSVTIL